MTECDRDRVLLVRVHIETTTVTVVVTDEEPNQTALRKFCPWSLCCCSTRLHRGRMNPNPCRTRKPRRFRLVRVLGPRRELRWRRLVWINGPRKKPRRHRLIRDLGPKTRWPRVGLDRITPRFRRLQVRIWISSLAWGPWLLLYEGEYCNGRSRDHVVML